MTYNEYKNILMKELDEGLSSIDERMVNQFVNELIGHRNQKIVAYAAGRMGYGLKAFIMRLAHLGFNAYWYGDTVVPHTTPADYWIFASGSGKTPSILKVLELAKEKANSRVALITGDIESPMAQAADLTVWFKTCNNGLNSENSPTKINSIQPMTTLNEQVMFMFFDLVALKIMEQLGEDNNTMAYRHCNVE